MVSLGARGYLTSRRVKRHGSQKQGIPPVADDTTRPSELPQENQDVLKKIREMKLGAHIDQAHSISIGRLGGKYYLMIVIDGIDFVWSQTCQVRTNPEDPLHEFLTISRLTIPSFWTFSLKRMDHTDMKSKDFSSGNKTHTYI
jgi:hypothetical protein